MSQLAQFLDDWAGLSPTLQRNLLLSLVVVLFFAAVRWAALRVVRRRVRDVAVHYRWRQGITYVTTGLALLAVGRIWFPGIQSVGTFLGLIGAGLTVAMHDTVANLTGWLFILWRRPFQVGDRIELGHTKGDVIDIRLFQFSVLEIGNWIDADQSTGRIVHIPNGQVLRERLASYTKGFEYIWHEIPVLVTFESDWRRAKQILSKIAEEHTEHFSVDAEEQIRRTARSYMIFYGKLTPIVYTTVRDSGVLLTMRFMCGPRTRRGVENTVWEAILDRFGATQTIDLAYPTMRRFDNRLEGKPGFCQTDPPS